MMESGGAGAPSASASAASMKNQAKYQEIEYSDANNETKQTEYLDDPQTTERNLGTFLGASNSKESSKHASGGGYSGLANQTLTGEDGDTERRFSSVTNNTAALSGVKDGQLQMKGDYGRSSELLETTTKALKY